MVVELLYHLILIILNVLVKLKMNQQTIVICRKIVINKEFNIKKDIEKCQLVVNLLIYFVVLINDNRKMYDIYYLDIPWFYNDKVTIL